VKGWIAPAFGLILASAGAGGTWFGCPFFSPYETWFLVVGLAIVGYSILRLTYVRADAAWPYASVEPQHLALAVSDYAKALVCWVDGYSRTYAYEPGLYFTGKEYDRERPLLVTANYRLTVFLLLRRLRGRNVRLLVIDSDGINVWCSAGKGRFSSEEILKQLSRYDPDLIGSGKKPVLVLPKFGMSGVEVRALREAGYRPVVGPLYARDLIEYLSSRRLENSTADRVVFGMRARLFTWLPGLVQYVMYSLVLALAAFLVEKFTGWPVPLGLIVIPAVLGTAYPILFPWIPGTRFAVKGLWLAGFVSMDLIPAIPFTFAVSLYVALSYTGNSAVSAYTRVRKEIATFLVPGLVLFLIAIAAWVAVEMQG
jgi:hypothetical protein